MRRYCDICCDIVTEAPGPHSCSMASRMSYAREHCYTEDQRNALISSDRPEQIAEQILMFSSQYSRKFTHHQGQK